MGTNFYLYTRKRELRNTLGRKAVFTRAPSCGYELHIAKTSCGWKPLFEEHENIHSVADIKNIYESSDLIQIFDEYGNEYDWDEFVDRVVQFGAPDYSVHWRTAQDNDMAEVDKRRMIEDEFTSSDGYRFSKREFN